MAVIKANTDGINGLRTNVCTIRSKNNNCCTNISRVKNNLDWQVKAKSDISGRITTLQRRINNQQDDLDAYIRVLQSAITTYCDKDKDLSREIKNIIYQMNVMSAMNHISGNGSSNQNANFSQYIQWLGNILMLFGYGGLPVNMVSLAFLAGFINNATGYTSENLGGGTPNNSNNNPFDIPGLSGKGAGAAADWLGYEFDDDGRGVNAWLGRASARAEGDSAYAGVNAYLGKAEAAWDADFSFMKASKKKEYNKKTGKWEEKEQFTVVNAEAEAGASVSAVSVDAETGVGVDALGIDIKGEGALGKAAADAKGQFSVSDKGVNAYVKGELKATGAEGEVKGTLNLGLFEVTGKLEGYAGSVGVEGEFGVRDNKFVVSGGVAAIIGFGAGVEIGLNTEVIDDVVEVVSDVKDGICDFAGDVADGISDAAEAAGNKIEDFMDWIGW